MRHWGRVALWNAGAALLVLAAFSNIGWRTPWRRLLEGFGVAYFISSCIGFPCGYFIPRIALALAHKPAPLKWISLVGAMVIIAMGGSTTALVVMWAFGYIPSGPALQVWIGNSLRVAIVVTLVFGTFAAMLEMGRWRHEAEARRLAAEARLASLESRVNPHFLFNTLNSIAELVRQDPAAAERMTTQFASLMRSTLDHDAPLVTLDDELRIVRAYLDIEKVRFGPRLEYRFDVEPDAAATPVPRLAVQTLVENSVKYAVSVRRAPTTIEVRARRTGGQLRVEVHDDGPGFPESAVVDGHGLALLKSRLAASFGDGAALTIKSRPGDTAVTIELRS